MRVVLLLSISFVFWSACSPSVTVPVAASPENTASPTALPSTATAAPTATSTLTPTVTSTPVPPLVAHEWSQSEPLITFTDGWGDGGPLFQYALPVEFTLLPSGDLYLRRWSAGLPQIVTTRLSRQATCQLLNSIDQVGFFDYDPSSYIRDPNRWNRPVAGPDNTDISVHAWRANSVSLFFLPGFLDPKEVEIIRRDWANCAICGTLELPTILSAIRDAYLLLARYQPPGAMEPLRPSRLGVWVFADKEPVSTGGAVEWPLKSHTLATAAARKGGAWGPPAIILTGTEARRVYDALHQRLEVEGMEMREKDKFYIVFARPLLPNEFSASPLPIVSLSCSPSDGWKRMP